MSRPRVYPWEKWFKKKRSYTYRKGKHFKCEPHGFAQNLRNNAYARGVKVSIQIEDSSVRVTIL